MLLDSADRIEAAASTWPDASPPPARGNSTHRRWSRPTSPI